MPSATDLEAKVVDGLVPNCNYEKGLNLKERNNHEELLNDDDSYLGALEEHAKCHNDVGLKDGVSTQANWEGTIEKSSVEAERQALNASQDAVRAIQQMMAEHTIARNLMFKELKAAVYAKEERKRLQPIIDQAAAGELRCFACDVPGHYIGMMMDSFRYDETAASRSTGSLPSLETYDSTTEASTMSVMSDADDSIFLLGEEQLTTEIEFELPDEMRNWDMAIAKELNKLEQELDLYSEVHLANSSQIAFPASMQLLNSPDIWIGDTGASSHTLFSKEGSKNERESQVTTRGVTGGRISPALDMDLDCLYCDKFGNEMMEMTLESVNYLEGSNYNLCSLSRML